MSPTKNRPTLLFVDDEPDIVDILARTFERNYDVLSASSANEAMELMRTHSVDLLLTDQRMPDVSGIELVTRAREAGFDATAILLTGYTDPQDIIDAINRGQVFRYVTKPWDVTELKITVKNALDHHFLRKERELLLAELSKRVDALNVLYEVSQSDAALAGYEALIYRVVQSFSRILPYQIGAVLVAPDPARPASLELFCPQPASEAALLEAKEKILAAWDKLGGARLNEGRLVVHVRGQPGADSSACAGTRNQLAAPLTVDGRPVGVIVLFSDKADAFREGDARLLEIFANQTAGVVRHLTAVLDSERRRVELMVDCMADGVILTDARNEILVINPAAKNLLHIDSPEKIDSRYLDEVLGFHPFELVRGWEYGGAQVLREELKVFDRTLHSTVSPVIDRQGALAGVALVLRDITEQKQLEARKEEFVSIISHELRTPLTAISGALDLVLNDLAGSVNEKQRRFLGMAKESADKLNAMVDDLLDLSKFARGKMRMSFEVTALDEVVRTAVERYGPAASERKLRIDFKPPAEPVKLVADADRLGQVLNNLISNAIKFSPEGGRIELQVGMPRGVSGFAVLSVANDGEPIPDADLERIFEKFEQGQAVRTRSTRGTGLGLAICRNIVEAHGGRIWAEAGQENGAKFVVVLPFEPPAAEPRSDEEAAESHAPSRTGTVLFVDDETEVAFALKSLLLARGHKCLLARSADEALALARKHHPEVVATEVHLPDLDGLALAEILRHDPDTRQARLLFFSNGDERARAFKAGASAYLQKPLDVSRFLATVDGLVAQRGDAPAARVLVVDDDPSIRAICVEVLSNIGYAVREADSVRAARELVREHRPEMILLDLMLPDGDGFQLLEEIKEDRAARHLSVILVTARGETANKVRALKLGADDYLVKPFDALELAARVESTLKRKEADLGASPTTRLPGALAIEREIQRRIQTGRPFAACYLDLDNLKAYNDRYGYAKADGVVQQTGDLLREIVGANEGDFIGHVAGDAFAFITIPERVDGICGQLIESFDRVIPLYYDLDDRKNGYIEVDDRDGQRQRVPIMTLSVAALISDGRFRDPVAIARAASELKRHARQQPGSRWVRSDREPALPELTERKSG